MSEQAYPLSWPRGRPRTAADQRKRATFNVKEWNGRWDETKSVSIVRARERLRRELDLLGAINEVLSTNVELRLDGQPRSDRRAPEDAGVALYFRLDGRDTALACDKWDRVADNIVAIAKHIEALRGMDRWGVGTREQAFAGYQALPAPEQWWDVLGVPRDADTASIDAAWRAKMQTAHPDKGGSTAAAARLNWARDEGRKANGSD
jgi:hypothetical protein